MLIVLGNSDENIKAGVWRAMASFKNPYHRAIIVGINDYDDFNRSSIESLNGCVNDALMFEQWLIDPNGGGLDPSKVYKHISVDPRPNPIRPMKDDVQEEIIRLIKEHQQTGARLGERLYLWFSGHGITPSRDEDECAILMANAQLLALGRSFPGRFAARDLCFRTMFKEVVLFMDCCRTVSGLETATVDYAPAGNLLGAKDVKYLQGFSAKSTAASLERMLPHPLNPALPDLMHGVFTHAVLEGLQKGTNLAGRVDSASLARYVKERAQQLMPPDDNQRPDFLFEEDQLIDFGPGMRFPVVVQLQDPAAGFQVRFGKDITQVINRTVSSANPIATLDLAPARYLFAVPGNGDGFVRSQIVEVLGGPVRVNL